MPEVGKSGAHNRLLAGIGAVVCLLLLISAVPRFIAGLYALYPESVLQHFQQTGRPLSKEAFQQSSADLENALAWFETAGYWQNQAFLNLLQAQSLRKSAPEKNQQLIHEAQDAIISGLRLSPVDPYAWFRLAAVDQVLGYKPHKVLDALRLSIYAGRVEPDLLLPRLTFAFPYRNEFDEEMRALLKGQIRLAWSFHGSELVEFTVNHPDFLLWIKDALIFSPDDWNRFSHDLENYIQKNKPSATKAN